MTDEDFSGHVHADNRCVKEALGRFGTQDWEKRGNGWRGTGLMSDSLDGLLPSQPRSSLH